MNPENQILEIFLKYRKEATRNWSIDWDHPYDQAKVELALREYVDQVIKLARENPFGVTIEGIAEHAEYFCPHPAIFGLKDELFYSHILLMAERLMLKQSLKPPTHVELFYEIEAELRSEESELVDILSVLATGVERGAILNVLQWMLEASFDEEAAIKSLADQNFPAALERCLTILNDEEGRNVIHLQLTIAAGGFFYDAYGPRNIPLDLMIQRGSPQEKFLREFVESEAAGLRNYFEKRLGELETEGDE